MKNSTSQIAFQNLVLLSLAILPVNQILAQDVCIADFSFEIDCGVVTFTDESTIPNTPSWQWTFSGGNPPTSTAQNPVVTFPDCDTYDVCLTVTGTGAGTACSETICQSVTIVDNTPPVALCLGIGVVLDANCMFSVTPGLIDDGSFDDCQIQSMSVSPSILTGCGEFPVTLTVTDWCGNTSTCTATVQTIEDVPPVMECPPNVTVAATTLAPCSMVVNGLSWLSATDNCGTPFVDYVVTGATSDFGQNDASGLTYNQGVSTVTYTATDDCGNTSTCSFTVTVICDTLGFPGVHCGQAVVTCFSGFNTPANYWSGVNQNAPVLALIDVRDHSTATPGTWWTQASSTEYSHPTWTSQNMGQVFGIAIDKNDDIFVAASSIYTCNTTSPITYNPFTAAGPGTIYKVDGATGLITNYITTGPFSPGGTFIPNNGSALGDIGYDATNDQFFVTNHADGMIYRIKNGLVMSRFDPFGSINPPATGIGSNADFVARGERIWGVAYYNSRVYFATWIEDTGRPIFAAANEVWSIGLDGLGEFQATTGTLSTAWEDGEVLEITIPTLPASTFSNPVSDIAFSADGRMLLAERTMESDCGGAFSTSWYGYAHRSRLLEYFFNSSSIWDLTPGHTIPITTTNLNLKFRTGDTNSGSNSAGGCDYGYASFDPAFVSQPDCDQFVWNTGDNLHPYTSYNSFCSQNGITWIYGMQGMSATGGTNLNSLLIDFDNNACNHNKILLGDVEIFECGCIVHDPDFPCDSLCVTKEPVIFDPGTMQDTCCWDIDFHIHAGPLAYLEVESLTPGVVFDNAALSSSFQWGGTPTGTLLPISYAFPGHGIPPGDYNDALTFCLGNILTPAQDTQCVVFRWYVFGPTDIPYLACADTCYFYCPPPVFGDTCAVIKNDSISCNPENPLEYCYFFQVQNLSDFNASQVVLNNPSTGFAFKPCPPPNISITSPTIALPNPPLNPGIEPDSCSPILCVKIVATSPVLSPTTFCFEVGLSSNDSCCHSSIEHCIVLEPCCDPCEDRGVVVHPMQPVDSCCHSLDITNDCEYVFFTKLELELLTPGVIFGSHSTGGPNPADWFNPISTNTLIQWQHITGSVPNGTIASLINFCLDEIDQPGEIPQIVVLNWLTTGLDGRDSIACSDTLIFDCPVVDNKCIEVLEQNLECIEDENGNPYYALTMIIQNVSTPPHTANELILTQTGGPPVTVFPNPVLFSLLPYWGMTTINTFIFGSGLNVGDKLTFEIRLHDSFSGDNWCCFEGDTVCVFIPPCDICCTDYDFFCQNVMDAVSISIDNVLCKATVNIGDLPDCNYLEGINWGDGSMNSGPFNSGDMPMHSYTGSGIYIISYLAIELDSNGLICFEKLLRDTIILDCVDLCPSNLVPNPSFETFITCPTGLAPPFTVASWTLPTGGSADYYNSCASAESGVSTPGNTFGSQAPNTGAGYAGFILRSVTNDYREYIEVPLSSPLINGINYQISFYVSLSDASQHAIDKIGAYLSVGSVGPITSASVLPYVPQVINPSGNYITDKSAWTLITGTFVGGGESHIVIGNFSNDSLTIPVTGLGGFYAGSYYYIDDVCVARTLVGVDDLLQGQNIRIYPNPNTGEFTVDLSELTEVGTNLRVFSLTGQLVSEMNIENGSPLQKVDTKNLPQGMYFLQIVSAGRVLSVNRFIKL